MAYITCKLELNVTAEEAVKMNIANYSNTHTFFEMDIPGVSLDAVVQALKVSEGRSTAAEFVKVIHGKELP